MTSRNISRLIVAVVLAVLAPVRAGAQDDSEPAKWYERFHLSGNADVTYFDGGQRSLAPNGQLAVENARLFLDVDVIDKWSFYLEWDLFRATEHKNQVGSLYLRVDKLGGHRMLNLKVGRFPIPFGEEYPRFHEDKPDNPLISYSAPAPYNWDEGVALFSTGDKLNYIVALQDGDSEPGESTDSQPQVAAKLMWQVTPSVYASLSAIDSGPVGKAALEWGGTHPRPFGASSDVPNYQGGEVVDRDPATTVAFSAFEADLILEPGRASRFWLAYGRADIESSSAAFFDRELIWYVAEARVNLGPRYYVAARYSAIGTFDDERGYLLEAMNGGDELGYNTEQVRALTVGGGVRLNKLITFKLEYSAYDFDLVRGVSAELEAATEDRDYFGLAISAQF